MRPMRPVVFLHKRCAGGVAAALCFFWLALSSPVVFGENGDVFGNRFRCGNPAGVSLCLTTLRPGCSLTITPGKGIPREPGDKVILSYGKETRVITEPSQLSGCVSLQSEDDALEYLRFFSSVKTVHLFKESLLEIFPARSAGCFLICLPEKRWFALGLASPTIIKESAGFKVTRLAIKPVPSYYEVTVFKITQEVTFDGRVRDLTSEPVTIPRLDRLRLGFPMYM